MNKNLVKDISEFFRLMVLEYNQSRIQSVSLIDIMNFKLRLEVLVPLDTKNTEIDDRLVFLTLDEFEIKNPDKVNAEYDQVKNRFPYGYKLSQFIDPLTLDVARSQGYGEGSATAACKEAHLGENKTISDTCTTVLLTLTCNDLLINENSESANILTKRRKNFSIEKFITERLQREVIDLNTYNASAEYEASVHEWIKNEYPKISSDALDRIVDVNKPDILRWGMHWAKKNHILPHTID
jgi:hypothetical protein